ncbi:GntR family transcriptional regulator [Kushneria phyllosphaerae]|uniref:GntR family transcriptional regulator n=1 Tax=Kushneria phyllosphaerae TaxID=2100822 RepID=UPI000D54E606|nr:GntR family transcriptional regulator [Kushneria phyllosphaerae]
MSKNNTSVVASLRQWIREGRYPAGERLAELHVAEHLGVSRTPVRLAFRTLEQEGLLERAGQRGYRVRAFTETDILCALEVRGALEGVAARRLAEQGLSTALEAQLIDCLDRGHAVLEKGFLEADDVTVWSELNECFHTTIIGSIGSSVIGDALARNDHLPFASADSIILDTQALDREYRKLHVAQTQHQTIVQALRQGEGARAEMLMREHAYIGLRYGELLSLDPPDRR